MYICYICHAKYSAARSLFHLACSISAHRRPIICCNFSQFEFVQLKKNAISVGSGGQGIQVANILQDPQIEESERIMFATHTKRLVIRGTGFALEGTELGSLVGTTLGSPDGTTLGAVDGTDDG